jgi:tetratricopeptide (TPR) repeat protein
MYRRNIWLLLISVFLQFSAPALSQSFPTLLKRKALTHMNAGRYGEAINVLDEIVAENSKPADSYNLRGICYEKRSQFDHAVSNFRQAAKLAPDNKQFKQNLSRAENKWKKVLQERIKGYRRDLAINPDLIEHYYSLGECYENLGNWIEAERWYDRYFQVANNASAEQFSHYTEVLARKNQLTKGLTLLEEYLDRQPDDYQMLNRYGYFLLWLGRFEEAYVIFVLLNGWETPWLFNRHPIKLS